MADGAVCATITRLNGLAVPYGLGTSRSYGPYGAKGPIREGA